MFTTFTDFLIVHFKDAHNCELEFDQSRYASLFAVYDGHGGSEVAQYCSTHLPQFLRNLPSYSDNSDLSQTLKQLFLDFDASLTTAETRSILRSMSDPDREDSRSGDDVQQDQNEENDEDEDESDSEISALRAEANQPLESVLERYGGEDALPTSIKDLLEYRRRTKVGECSTSSTASSSSTASTSSPAKTTTSVSSDAVNQFTPEKSPEDGLSITGESNNGTTACVAVVLPINGKVRLYVANAGDSRAVLCRGRAAVDLSVDHKPEDEDEKARIQAAGGTVTRDGRVNGGLNLSRALGDHNYKQVQHLSLAEQMITPTPDISQYDLIPGSDEFVVIACDGVWNSMTSQEVVDFVYDRLHPAQGTNAIPTDKKAEPTNSVIKSDGGSATGKTSDGVAPDASQLSRICEEIFDHCLAPNTEGDGTGCDNMTCIIIRFKDLEGLAKRACVSVHSEPIVSDSESRKRPATDDAHQQDNEVSSNGHVISAHSPKITDATCAKRLKHDSNDHPATAATTVSNGQSS
ncbi:Protein phosphatase 2C [Fasciolopsis buskii]|uniref:protein-serine/threonine phosphatase n=1 Tax=Fasciolopsis buskii TaxID=27845 RepID=A0A8E0RR56_9TREM|nr:Protein phosphatase 2C [Fasciolopsis buski]